MGLFAGAVGCGTDGGGGAAESDATTEVPTTTASTVGDATEASTTGDDAVDSTTSSSGTTESDDGAVTTETGAHEWSIASRRITDQNRHYPEMYGGWGPHLRAIMRDDAGVSWFAIDRGEDVLHNRSIVYLRRDGDVWSEVATQDHTGGVQQNAAHLLQAGTIHTYAVDVASHWLTHCTFTTATATPTGCNALVIGGPYVTPASSNYVGAALLPGGAHLVWFTVVGESGGAGQFAYSYDFGGGWNGPVVTALPGFNDVAYLFASFTSPSHATLLGTTFTGVYPNGTFDAVVVELELGQPAQFVVLAAEGGLEVSVGNDIWVDPTSGAAHVLASTAGGLGYWFRPPGEAWPDHAVAREIVASASTARFVAPTGGPFAIADIGVGTGALEIRIAATAPDQPATWTEAETIAIPTVTTGFDPPSALWVEGPTYQDTPPTGLHVAACGQYPNSDGEIWQVELE
jgi:hypothetical protein